MKRILFLILFLYVGTAGAAYLGDKYPVCISESAFDRLSAAARHDDLGSIEKIMGSECVFVDDGTEIEKVVSQGWTSGVAHVKVYVSGDFVDLWTNTENLKAGKKE